MNDLAIPKSHRPTLPVEVGSELGILQLAEHLARSGFFSDTREVSQAVVKILAGRELGLGPIAAMSGLHIIKGKVVQGANLLACVVKRSGKYDFRIKELTEKVCSLEFFERGESLGLSTFTISEAERAGLTKASRNGEPSNWVLWPKNMLFARAISNGVKFFAADLTGGPVYMPEELGAVIDGETGEVLSLPAEAPRPAAEPTRSDQSATAQAPPQARRQQWEAGFQALLHDAIFLEVSLDACTRFKNLDVYVLTDAELHEAIKELKSLVKLRRLELEQAPEEERSEERDRAMDHRMDRASADEDP